VHSLQIIFPQHREKTVLADGEMQRIEWIQFTLQDSAFFFTVLIPQEEGDTFLNRRREKLSKTTKALLATQP
jgi:hypothetical protein